MSTEKRWGDGGACRAARSYAKLAAGNGGKKSRLRKRRLCGVEVRSLVNVPDDFIVLEMEVIHFHFWGLVRRLRTSLMVEAVFLDQTLNLSVALGNCPGKAERAGGCSSHDHIFLQLHKNRHKGRH